MKNKAPVFSEKEKKLLEDYRAKSSRMPRQNLVDFISHVDPGTAELGMNSGAYVMLDRIMTDEMIEFASHLKLRTPVYIEELAKMTGNSIEYTAKMADDLCRIGVLVYKPDDMGVDRVELPIFVVGMLEQLMLGGLDEDQFAEHPELPVGFTLQTTQTATKNGPLLPAANLGVHRPVPIESALKNETRVESWENLEHLIESCANGSYAIVDCICRKIRKAYGELGDAPELGWCMPIGYFADYAVRTGKGHYVTKEEYYAKLKEADERGYVHNVCNHEGKDYIEYVCNCDYQSCMSLRAALYTGAYNMQKSNFVATVDASKCVACGSCVEKCPANAVRLGQKLGQKHKTEYASKPLPNETNQLVWGEEHYDPLYLLHRSSIREETGTAPCKVNCPAHIAVQGYLRMAAQGRYREALELIKKENPLPAVCGSICNRRCESACTRGSLDQPLAVDEVKKFLAYRELQEADRFVPKKVREEGKKVAVIGAGPAGISAAYYLAVEGHSVTVFDRNAEPGGMLRYGVPSFRLEKDVLASEIEVLRTLGVAFRSGVEIGKDVTIQQLREEGYAGFVIAIGAQKSSALRIPGEELTGVYGGVDFLREVNMGGTPDIGEKVAVVGGGNVALDVARTAIREGAKDVTIVYRRTKDEMPADPAEVVEAVEEGVQFRFLNAPTEVLGENGKVTGLKVEIMQLGEPDEKGRRKPVGTGRFETIEVTSVIGAIGQVVDWGKLDTGLLRKDKKNLAISDDFTFETAQPDIFAAGDVTTGPKFAIDAIAAGKQAAISLHRYVWGNDLRVGRNLRDFRAVDKDNVIVESYDTARRQVPPVDESKRKTMRDERGVFTEEQVKAETNRCLKCGAAHVDENMCFGCGVCTTRCKFDAITLKKKYDVVPVPNEELKPTVVKEVGRRINAEYGDKPVMKKVVGTVVKQKAKVHLGKARPRKW